MGRITLLTSIAVVVLVACGGRREKKGTVVAEGKDVVVTVDEVKAKLEEQSPFVRARYATLERKKELVEGLIRFELLAAEARKQKLDQDPEVQSMLERIMVQKLVRQSFDEKDGPAAVPEAEVREYYESHAEEFVRPERVRISLVYLRAEPGSPERARKAAEAKKLLAALKGGGAKNPLAFGNMARDHSEDPASKAAGGDIGFRSRDDLEKAYSKPLAEAAFALKTIGQESDVVETTQGFYILKLGGRQPGVNRTFEEVKPQLAARLGRERRSKQFEEYVKKLRSAADVTVNDAVLDRIVVSAAAPARAPGAGAALPGPVDARAGGAAVPTHGAAPASR
jgi:peptidyl-prolyl cis-trans isomerase C